MKSAKRLIPWLLLIAAISLTTGCARLQQNSLNGPGWYRVQPTDTFHAIAWRYGLDHQDLAVWNGLSEPYAIEPGQQLILIEPDEIPRPKTVALKLEPDPPTTAVKLTPLKPDYQPVSEWLWPTEGQLLTRFDSRQLNRQGIDIKGKLGQPVKAVAAGKVVYSGTGLSGYGNLIIIKHNDLFLSAYAHNRKRLVNEGMMIKQGQQIAEMGVNQNGDSMQQALLHFQIRKKGKPVDPMIYLPKRIN